ncbi:LapA family protein [Pacificibacter sp. AS14]|uniref:LapA family protein n=1 Tax=Pacificibacter sp. AS14 TaxID=3135785 RepID=UPI00316EFAB8
MRTIRYVFLAALAVALITIALANRAVVTLDLLPAELAEYLGIGYSVSLPMFIVIFGAIIAGLLIGFIWEWMREYKHRAAAVKHRREKDQLAREVSKLKVAKAKSEGDEVLALLDA